MTLVFYCILSTFGDRAGGVELLARKGKIRIVNTLESRLDLMGEQVS